MVTAYGNMKNIREAMNNGAFDFVTKPVDRKILISAAEEWLEKSREILAESQTLLPT